MLSSSSEAAFVYQQGSSDYRMYDVREPHEVSASGIIETAVNIPCTNLSM